MTTVLALYPGTFAFRQEQVARHRPLFAALGIEIVIADDRIDDADRELFDGWVEIPPPEQVGETCRVLDAYCASRRIDALLAQSEGALLPGSLFASRHGLVGLPPAAANLCANKLLCRRALERAGVPQPAFTVASDAAGVVGFARGAGGGFPVVLKGIASTLGRLVTLVPDEAAVAPAVERMRHGLAASLDIARLRSFAEAAGVELGCDAEREFLVESYAPGDPIETDGIVVGSEPRSFGVTAQVLSKLPHFFVEGYLLPADLPARDVATIESVSDAALAALGVRDSGYSIEMRLGLGEMRPERGEMRLGRGETRTRRNEHDPSRDGTAEQPDLDGARRVPRVIEVNGRLGWDEGFGDLFETITGKQPSWQALELALGASRPFARRGDVRVAVAYRPSYREGVVVRVPSAEEIAAVEAGGVRVGLVVEPGTRTYAAGHPDISPHLAFALAKDATSSQAAFEKARAAVGALRFDVSAGSQQAS